MLRVPPAIYKSTCQIDVRYFPFDEQSCDMVFGSWTFSAEQLDYIEYFGNNTWVDFADYMESAVWDMCVNQIATTAAKVQPERGQPPQSRLIITIKIRRKTLFYLVNLIIPVVLISFLSTGVFYLPSDACEKITLCISILISIVVFILLVVKILPPTSVTVPLISKYLLFTFIMNVISIFTTVIVINWHFRSPHSHRMRRWVKVFFLNYLPRILLMKRPNHDEQYRKFLRQSEVKSSPSSPPGAVRPQYGVPEGSPLRPTPSTNNASPWIKPLEQNNKHVVTEETKPISKEIYEATDAVDYITGQLKFQDEYNRVLSDWKYVAMVIDRLLLYIFLLVTAIGTLMIILDAPTLFSSECDAK